MKFSRQQFDDLVAKAVDGIPPEFREKLDNVYVTVEDHPTPEDYQEAGLGPGELLLGLYRGVPLRERSPFAPIAMPDHIAIFQRPIETVCRTRAEIVEEIRRTVLHEVAHHFGLSEERIDELGY